MCDEGRSVEEREDFKSKIATMKDLIDENQKSSTNVFTEEERACSHVNNEAILAKERLVP